MKIELEGVIHVGEIVIAALAQSSVHCFGKRRGSSAHCVKRPVAILIRHNDAIKAFEIDGVPIPLDVFEQRFPGQYAAFERLAAADGNSA